MISPELTLILFIVLFALVMFNLVLSTRLTRALKKIQPASDNAEPLPAGIQLPALEATQYVSGAEFDYGEINEDAKVFLFLSSQCPKCKSKLDEVQALVNKSRDMGVSIWLLTDEKPRRMKRFLKATSLYDRVLGLSEQLMDMLNPVKASPYYLFVDQNNVLQAEGLIGDQNWLDFSQQIQTGE